MKVQTSTFNLIYGVTYKFKWNVWLTLKNENDLNKRDAFAHKEQKADIALDFLILKS